MSTLDAITLASIAADLAAANTVLAAPTSDRAEILAAGALLARHSKTLLSRVFEVFGGHGPQLFDLLCAAVRSYGHGPRELANRGKTSELAALCRAKGQLPLADALDAYMVHLECINEALALPTAEERMPILLRGWASFERVPALLRAS